MFVSKIRRIIGLIFISLFFLLPASSAIGGKTRILRVTATAYNSLPSQTSGNPSISAWGDKLKPGMKAIAVSRDLIKKGLTHGVKVKIGNLPGKYIVRDKMGKRWKRKIDIYMGKDVRAARKWGRRKVKIQW